MFEFDDIKVAVDRWAQPYLAQAELDYEDGTWGGFRINYAPQSSCG